MKLNLCPKFLALDNETRLQSLLKFKVCFNCFNTGQYANKCKKSGCKLCKRRHNTHIHVNEYNVLKQIMHGNRCAYKNGSSPSTTGSQKINLDFGNPLLYETK